MKNLANIFVFTLIISTFSIINASAFSGEGSGTEADPYQITTVEQLQEMNDDLSAHYILMNDIDASATSSWNSGKGFIPVGTFTGALNGNGFTVYSLYINRPATDYVGLFGKVGEYGEIINTHLVDLNISGNMCVGGLIGFKDGTGLGGNVIQCSTTGVVNAQGGRVGGLIGQNTRADILNCNSTCDVYATGGSMVGGLIGVMKLYGEIENCYSTGDVYGYGASWMGGLAGLCQKVYVRNSYSAGNLIGDDESDNIGGLAGVIYDCFFIEDSYSTGNVSGAKQLGGFAGVCFNYAGAPGLTIQRCYSTGNVVKNPSASGGISVGGFIGEVGDNSSAFCYIDNCFSTGNVTGNQATHVGGFAGYNINGDISKCYSYGTPSGNSAVGGFCGDNNDAITDSFWDTTTSGTSNGVGSGSASGVTGKTTAEMKDVATFTSTATSGLDNPWDFVGDPNDDTGSQDYWNIKQGINSGYPYLKFEEPSGNIFYVDKNAAGLGNGLSWTNAYNYLQDALNDK